VVTYYTLETTGSIYTHDAVAHRQIGSAADLIIAYNVNSDMRSDWGTRSDCCRPTFIRVRGWERAFE